MRYSGYHGMPYHPERKRKKSNRHADAVYAVRSKAPGDRVICRGVLRRRFMGRADHVSGWSCVDFPGRIIGKKITGYKFRKTFFIIELPEYKIPSLKRATLSMLSRGKAYIVKAGTIILVCNTAVQIMQSFNWQFQVVEEGMEHTSILASIASPLQYF